ncbi:heme-binding protein [Thiomonas sp. FB-6]|uniref:GlcG/HbpS family heme-binding protein n=1 Tax=Thiomonas sp. FB-6 TaxID=1158291 RepID=UPI00037619AD|nr:heme-binding protein [Thiomonas sp. FB-6]
MERTLNPRIAGPALAAALLLAPGALPAARAAGAAQQPLALGVQRLSLDAALKAAQAALAKCRAEGLQVGVTVVDRDGLPQVMLRDVLAPELTLRVSRRKAYTAASFNSATSSLQARGAGGLAHVPGLLFEAGAVPISAAGTLYGAIGVSGAPSGVTDEGCARAGAESLQDDLEMRQP